VLLSTFCCGSSFTDDRLRSLLLSLALDVAAGLSTLSMKPLSMWFTLRFFLLHEVVVFAEPTAGLLSAEA